MSCEDDDDYGWDDPEPVVEIKKLDIHIKTVSKKQQSSIEEALTICLDRKMEKLNLLLKQMSVYQVENCLLINDRYNTAFNFIEIVKGFGMDICQVSAQGMKGKTYLVGDVITKLLAVLGVCYDFSKVIKLESISSTVNVASLPLFDYSAYDKIYDNELSSFLIGIKREGSVKIEGTETFIDGISQGVVSDQNRVIAKLQDFLSNAQKQACVNNRNIQHGTTEILYARARQMGYSVEKKQNGKDIQLVLVRVQ